MSMRFDEKETRELQDGLLAWYVREKRDLPWRRTRDAYAIWVSEVMLQQTRVETVKRYYDVFLSRFPTVEALAAAPLDDVLAAWSGLGYYARARSLHRAAKEVVERHCGRLPASADELSGLPGFGPYTTAAVGSIAFGLDLAAVDGNVARVFTRWTCREGDPRTPKALAELRALGAELLPLGRAGDWNQALMELGASLCGPGTPDCASCPVERLCTAKREGRQDEIPPRRRAKARPTLRLAAALARRGGELLLARRPDSGLFASLWELPGVEVEEGGDERALLHRSIEAMAPGARVAEGPKAVVAQTLTHRELTIAVYEVEVPPGVELRVGEPYLELRFSAPGERPPGGLSSATKKALAAALGERDPKRSPQG